MPACASSSSRPLDAAAKHEQAAEWTEALKAYEPLRPYAASLPELEPAIAKTRARMNEAGTEALTRARQFDSRGRMPEAIAWYQRAVGLAAARSPGPRGRTPAPRAVGRPAMTDAELDDRLAELLQRQADRAGGHARPGAHVPALPRRRRWRERWPRCTSSRRTCCAGLLEEITGTRAVDPSLMTVYPDFVTRVNQLLPAGPRRAAAGLPRADGDQRAPRLHAEPDRRVDDPCARGALGLPRVPAGDATRRRSPRP